MPSGVTFASLLTAATTFILTDFELGAIIVAVAVVGLAGGAIRRVLRALR